MTLSSITTPSVETLILSTKFDLSLEIAIQAQPEATCLRLRFKSGSEQWCELQAPFDAPPSVKIRQSVGGWTRITGHASDGGARFALSLRSTDADGAVELVERSSKLPAPWTLRFRGPTLHTHQQLRIVTAPVSEQRFRFGAFSQHGQLLDFRDWFFVENESFCSGALALTPGKWTPHPSDIAKIEAGPDGVAAQFPESDSATTRRRLLLIHVPAAQALARHLYGTPYFEPKEGYAVWPAQMIARHGYARPERLDAYRRQTLANPIPAPKFALGALKDLHTAIERIKAYPDLAGGDPFWRGDYPAAADKALKCMEDFLGCLITGAYLHPMGNPVACRVLAPAAMTLHMLDCLGLLDDEQRTRSVAAMATLAHLLHSRDFYAWHIATFPPEFPYGPDSVYRGMLNQNFNTDRYVLVGVVGCVLPWHPLARRWREHAIAQFREQMKAFVWPSGAWEESHTYANHVQLLLAPLVALMRHAQPAADLAADPRFVLMSRFFAQILSPHDAVLEGRRGIPAVGDHRYAKHGGFAYVLGWLARLLENDRPLLLWAWREAGTMLTDSHSSQASVFSPLMIADPAEAAAAPAPALPPLLNLTGYGAAARRDLGLKNESLLVVRCGPSWGHYHPDQGSFWWWAHGRLIVCDADLGDGKLKFEHVGHSVMGYPDRAPLQHLDRVDYHVDQCAQDGDAFTIRCQIPVVRWHTDRPWLSPEIPIEHRPHDTRTFHWKSRDLLQIDDLPLNSPDGKVNWTVHVVARAATVAGPRTVRFELDEHLRLEVTLNADQPPMILQHQAKTWQLTVEYPAQALTHTLALLQTSRT